MAIETRLNSRWRKTKTQHTQAFSDGPDDCCEDALVIFPSLLVLEVQKGHHLGCLVNRQGHFGILYFLADQFFQRSEKAWVCCVSPSWN